MNLVDEEIKLNKEIEKELKQRLDKKRETEKQQICQKLNNWKVNNLFFYLLLLTSIAVQYFYIVMLNIITFTKIRLKT